MLPRDFANASVRRIAGFLGATEASFAPRDNLVATNGNVNSTGATTNTTARSYYERGKEFFFRYNLADQDPRHRVVPKSDRDRPNYGQAHAMLATTCELRSPTDPDPQWPKEAEKARPLR